MRKQTLTMILLFLASLASVSVEAICLKDCQTAGPGKPVLQGYSQKTEMNNQSSFNREKSPDTRDVRNSVLGDITLQVGHQQMEIKDTSDNAMINASVTSVINLGDVTNK